MPTDPTPTDPPPDVRAATPADDLPELTLEERQALAALPCDFIDRLLKGDRLEFNADGTPKRWVKAAPPAQVANVEAAFLNWWDREHPNEPDPIRKAVAYEAWFAATTDELPDKPKVFTEDDDSLREALDHESSVIVTTAFLRTLLAPQPADDDVAAALATADESDEGRPFSPGEARAIRHKMNCAARTPGHDHECTCGLYWRDALATEQTMHAAWRKRAEEAEIALADRERETAALRALTKQTEQQAREWADDHDHLQALCRKTGVPEAEIIGSPDGVPGIGDLAEMLAKRAEAAEAENVLLSEACIDSPAFAEILNARLAADLAARRPSGESAMRRERQRIRAILWNLPMNHIEAPDEQSQRRITHFIARADELISEIVPMPAELAKTIAARLAAEAPPA